MTTTLDTSASASTRPSRLSDWGRRVDGWLSRASDSLSAILVKEARQAIKSRQFLITFGMLLIGAWAYTFVAIAMIGPGIYYNAHGPELFYGYFLMLGFCTLVVVPFGAGRSLASEREDGTYEMLSITTMGPHQIVAGKLASALMQAMLYYSVLAPCLAFTYLLQGIDFPTILYVMVVVLMVSALLTMVAVAAATLTKDRHWNMLISGGLLFATAYAFMGVAATVHVWLFEESLSINLADFWIANAAALSAYATTFAILFLASAAQLNFASANRSTPLRVAILVQYAVAVGWAAVVAFHLRERFPFLTYELLGLLFLNGSLIYWSLVGIFLTNESAELSHRVRRRLPKSLFARLFLAGFNPGPGAGLLFSLAGAITASLLGLATLYVLDLPIFEFDTLPGRLPGLVLLGLGYMAFFLSVGYSLTILARRNVNALARLPSFPTHVLLVIGLSVLGLLMHWAMELSNIEYSGWLLLNPLLTMYSWSTVSWPISEWSLAWSVVIVSLAGLAALAVSLPLIVDELAQTRLPTPQRILEEDAQNRPAVVARPQPQDPWDRPEDQA